MMSFFRQLMGRSRRNAEADALKEQAEKTLTERARKTTANRLVLERLVCEIKRNTKSCQ